MASTTPHSDGASFRRSSSILIREHRAWDESGEAQSKPELHALEETTCATVADLRFESIPGATGELLMAAMLQGDVRVNGLLAARLEVVRLGDVVRAPDGSVVHVARYEAYESLRPSGPLLERCCATCRGPLTADTRVRVCSCGEPRHEEGDDVPEEDRLDCWLLGACPSCGAAGPVEPGFSFWPEGIPQPSKETP